MSNVLSEHALKWGDGSIYRRVYDIDPDPELTIGGRASGDNAIDFERIENIACGSGTWNDMTPPFDPGDVSTDKQNGLTTPSKFYHDYQLRQEESILVDDILAICPTDLRECERSSIIANACQSAVMRDKERPTKMDSCTCPVSVSGAPRLTPS